MRGLTLFILCLAFAGPAGAGTITVSPETVTEWKSVYGQIETRDRVPARARIGGTVQDLSVTEGDRVEAGATIARVEDQKLAFQLDSLTARLDAAKARLETAQADLDRGQTLLDRGVITSQRLEQLQTDVDVIKGEIGSLQAEKLVVEQQVSEGEVLAPEAGVVLSVPVSRGSVVTPGEMVAEVGGGGVFLRLAVPERHATSLAEGDEIEIGTGTGTDARTGRLVKLYPQIEGGRVQADVEVEGLDDRFVGRRVPVRLPVGERQALLVPQAALARHGGLDVVTVEGEGGATVERVVVPGQEVRRDGETWREILSGLPAGAVVVTPDE